jgi:flavin reductase (DIM6/NTAB) family NADH-FMN oxidoreductase RutF
MYYDTNENNHGLPHNPFKALTVPRPIGWISTLSKNGIGNLSPYSYFNGLSYDPPFVMFSAGNRADGSKKDSVLNAEEIGEFVVNISTLDTRFQMNDTSWIMEPETDELEKTGLTAIDSINVKPKRVAESPVHFECKYHQTVQLPGNKNADFHHVVFGQVIGIHIKDEFITDEGIVDILKMKIISRLGYNDYTLIDKTFSIIDFKDKRKMTKNWK